MKIQFFITALIAILFLSCNKSIPDLLVEGAKLMEQKEYKKALDVYTKVLRQNRRIQEAYLQRGNCFQELKDYSNALYTYDQLIELKGGDSVEVEIVTTPEFKALLKDEEAYTVTFAEVKYQRGIVRYKTNRLQLAYGDFFFCINRDFERANCYLWIGTIWLCKNSAKKACEYFNKAKELNEPQADEFLNEYCK